MLDDRENVYAQTEMAPRRQRSEPPATPLDGSATHVRSDPVYVLKAQLFRVLGHPVRIRILELLTDGERTVGDLQDALSLDSSGTSQHLTALREQAGLSQRALADRLGVSQPRIAAIERSKNVTVELLEQYVEALGGHLRVTVVKGNKSITLISSGSPTASRSTAKRVGKAAAKKASRRTPAKRLRRSA